MSAWRVAGDIGGRLAELRQLLGETQREFAARFGRQQNQVGYWERGEYVPPRSVLERGADRHGWPIVIFTEGGPRPGDVLAARLESGSRVAETGAPYMALQAAVNAAVTDVVRWTAEGLTIEQAATRAIQLITRVADAARAEMGTTAGGTADLVEKLRQRIGDLAEGRGAAAPAPPGKAAGGG